MQVIQLIFQEYMNLQKQISLESSYFEDAAHAFGM